MSEIPEAIDPENCHSGMSTATFESRKEVRDDACLKREKKCKGLE